MAWLENEPNGIELPDGKVISFPAGITREQAYQQLMQERPDLFEKPSGFFPAARSTVTRMAGALSAAPSTVLGGFGSQESLDEAGRIYEETNRAAAEILPEPVEYTDIFDDYEKKGLADAASTAWTFAKEQVGISTPYMLPAMAAGKVGASDLVAKTKLGQKVGAGLARLLPVLRAGATASPHPLAKAGFGAAFAIGTLATQFFADNLERQYEVASEGGQKDVTPEDINNFAAAAAAGPQAAMDYIFIALTGGIGRGAQLAATQSLKQSLAATTTRAGKETLSKTIGKGALESLTEFPTELMQTVLERAQAGESISLDDVGFVDEMKATVAGTIPVVGVFGAAGTYRSHRANKKAEENWNKMSDAERRLRKSQDSQREAAYQAEIERAERIQSENENRWRLANEEAGRNNDTVRMAGLQAQENTPVEIADVIEAADSRNILTNTDGFRAFVLRQTNGRTANLKDTDNKERRKIRSVLSGLKVQEYVEEDGGADMPMFTRAQFDAAVKGTRKAKSINGDTVRQVLGMGNSKTDRAVASSIVQALETRGYAQRVSQKDRKKPLKPRRTPYTENQYEELLRIGQENGRITQGDFESVTGKYGAETYKEFISDMRVRGDLPKTDKVKGMFTPVTYQDIQEADDGRALKVGDYEVTTEPSEGYFVRNANGEIVDGAINRKEAINSAKRLKHRSRSYTVKKNGQEIKTYKNKNNAKSLAEEIETSDPGARVEVLSNQPVDFAVDKNKSSGFATIERVNEEGRTTSVLEYGFAPDENSANILRDERISELTPGLADWDVRSAEEKSRARERLAGFFRARGARLDPALREEFATAEELPSFAPERRIEGDQTQRNQTILKELEQALVDAGVKSDVAAKVINESVNAEGFFDPNLGGLRTIAINLNHPTVRNATTDAEIRQAVRDVVNHEAIHAMRDLDLFTMNEWRALVNATYRVKRSDGKSFSEWAEETYKGVNGYETEESIQEEAVAEMYRQFYSDKNVRRQIAGRPRTLLERIQRFMEKLANAFSGIGFADASQVISNIGTVQSRERNQIRTLKDTEESSAQQARIIRGEIARRQADSEQPEERKVNKTLKRHSITSQKMLGEFERREEESDSAYKQELIKEMSKRSVAGDSSYLLEVPGGFVPADMTAKFSLKLDSMTDSDLNLLSDTRYTRRLMQAAGIKNSGSVDNYMRFANAINRAVRNIVKGQRVEDRRILNVDDNPMEGEELKSQIETLEAELQSVKNTKSRELHRPQYGHGFLYNDSTIPLQEGVIQEVEKLNGFAFENDGHDMGYQEQSTILTSEFEFSGDLKQEYDLNVELVLNTLSERDYTSFNKGHLIVSAVQEELENGSISFIKPAIEFGHENHLPMEARAVVVLSDYGKLKDLIDSGKTPSAVTIASLHKRYVNPIIDSLKHTGSSTQARLILRSLDNSELAINSTMKGLSDETPRFLEGYKAVLEFSETYFDNKSAGVEGLKQSIEEIVKDKDNQWDNGPRSIQNFTGSVLQTPVERAHAAIFKYIFESTTPATNMPTFRGTTLSRFLFDISSRDEAGALGGTTTYEEALDWANERAVSRTISIDGIGELSSKIETAEDDFNDGLLFVLPAGNVRAQTPAHMQEQARGFDYEAGLFTSGTFEVKEFYPFKNALEYNDLVINVLGRQLMEMAEQRMAVSKGERSDQDIYDGVFPLINKSFSPMSNIDSLESWKNSNDYIIPFLSYRTRSNNTKDLETKIFKALLLKGLSSSEDSASKIVKLDEDGKLEFDIDWYYEWKLNQPSVSFEEEENSLIRTILFRAITGDKVNGAYNRKLFNALHTMVSITPPVIDLEALPDLEGFVDGNFYYWSNSPQELLKKAAEDANVFHYRKDDDVPSAQRGRGVKGGFVVLNQLDNDMKSFGANYLASKDAVKERAPVIGWTRSPKWSIVNVDEGGFQQVGSQTGSNAGGMYRNEDTGEQYYVKTPRDPDIGRNEILASKLYQLAGVEVADANPAVRNGEFSVASSFVPGLEMDEDLLASERVPGVQENFAVDAWLGNWDVVGLVFDNLLIKEGRGVRIDPGGTMAYRAQGGLKNDMRAGLWGPEANDIDSMRDMNIAPEASQVFDKVTDEDLVKGIDKVLSIPVDDLRKAVSEFGPVDPEENEEAFNILEARRRDLASRRADIVGDSSAAAQFTSTGQPGRKFSLNDLQWKDKGTASQETSSVESFSPDKAIEKVSESTNERGRERDRKIIRAMKDFKTSPDFDITEITPKEWGPIENISSPSYGVMVKDDKDNIVLREVENSFKGYNWSIAKGKLDPGESPLETALRELKEETGISEDTVPNFRIIGALPGPYSSDESDTYFYVAQFDSQTSDQGISKFGDDLINKTPGFIPRISKEKSTVSADQSIMDNMSIPIALGEMKPRKLSLSNEKLVELTIDTARTKGDRSYDVLHATISPPPVHKSLWESVKDVLSDRPLAWFRQKFIDKYEGIRRAVEKAREIRGDESYMLAGMDALKAAYLSDKSKGIVQEAITSGRLVYRDGITRVDTNEKGLIEILQPLFKGEVDLLRDWHVWKIAIREGRFEKEGRMVSMSAQERQTVMDTAQANGWTELFESVDADYREWNDAIVDYMKDTGIINDSMGEVFKKYGDYIAFYREFEGEADERLIAGMQDLIGEELAQMERDGRMPPMNAAQKSRMPSSMFGSLTGAKPPRKARGGDSMVVDPLTGIMRNLEAAVTSGMKNVAATRVMDDAVLIGMATEVEPSQVRADTHSVRMDGEDRYFNVFDPLLHDSLAGMAEGHIKYLNFFSAPAQFLREMVTRSPDFIMANLLRDSLSTWTTAGGTKPVIDTMRSFFSGENDSYQTLKSAGIISGFDNARTTKDLVKKFTKKLKEEGQMPGKKIPFWSSATKLWDWSGDVSTKSDAATRQAVYESVLQDLLEKGFTRGQAESEAIYQAAEVINFSRRGNSGLAKIITAVVPFLNARVQGLDVLYRAGTGKYSTVTNETRNKALIGFLSRASLLATASLMYAGMVEDEDEYKNAKPEVRDDNWIIPGFGDMPGFKIPVPFEVGFLFKTVPERVYHYYSGDQTYKQSVDAIKRGVASTLEINVFGPQFAKPVLEAMMNHSFYTGSTIVPWYLTRADPEYQKRLSTNELAVTIGEAFDASPLKVEHVLRGYTGTLGGYILTVADWAMRNVKGLPARPTLRADQMMIARRFLQSAEGSAGAMSEWYAFRNSTTGILNAFNSARNDGDIEKAREIFEENSGVISMKPAINAIDTELERLRRAERFILLDTRTDPDQKAEAIKRIDALRNAILSSSNKVMEKSDLSPRFPFPLSALND